MRLVFSFWDEVMGGIVLVTHVFLFFNLEYTQINIKHFKRMYLNEGENLQNYDFLFL